MIRVLWKYIGLFCLLAGLLATLSSCEQGGAVCKVDTECFGVQFCDLKRHMCSPKKGACLPGAIRVCYSGPVLSADVGICRKGKQTCQKDKQWGSCEGEQPPKAERCDGKDNNCNGKIDEVCESEENCKKANLPSKLTVASKLVSERVVELTVQLSLDSFNKGWEFSPIIKILPDSWRIQKATFEPEIDKRRIIILVEASDKISQPTALNVELQLQLGGEVSIKDGAKNRCLFSYTTPKFVVCKPGQHVCDRKCVDLSTDPRNCGLCGAACFSPRICTAKKCVCLDGKAFCNGKCVDLSSDSENCGACGALCSSPKKCNKSKCTCPDAKTFCSGRCVELQTDVNHCGTCGNQCKSSQKCNSGKCECTNNKILCGEYCIDIKNDDDHCGECNKRCVSPRSCSEGKCVCPNKKAFCNGRCVDTRNDDDHCGQCGNTCKLKGCFQGACPCPAGQNRCGRVCVDLFTSNQHCGACGASCAAPKTCVKGLCTCSNAGTVCANQCVVLDTDVNHCGGCGKKCSPKEVCKKGKCSLPCTLTADCGAGEFCRSHRCLKCPGHSDCDKVVSISATNSVIMRGVLTDKSGNIYVAGDFIGKTKLVPSVSLTSKGEKDLFVVKFDSKGKLLWYRSMGGPKTEQIISFRIDSLGNVYLSGVYGRRTSYMTFFTNLSTATKTLKPIPNYSYATYVAKISTAGKLEWANAIGGGRYNNEGFLAVTPSGVATFAFGPQRTQSTRSLLCNGVNLYRPKDPVSEHTQTGVVQIDTKGKCSWGRLGGDLMTNQPTVPQWIQTDAKGDSYVFGLFRGRVTFGSFTLTGGQGDKAPYSFYNVKLNAKGAFTDAKKLDSELPAPYPFWAKYDAQGNLYITFFFTTTITIGKTKYTPKNPAGTTSGPYKRDILVLKYSSTGTLLWAKQFGGTSNDYPSSIFITSKGQLIITGACQGDAEFGSVKHKVWGLWDGFLLALNPKDGKILWHEFVSGSDADYVGRVWEGLNGLLYVETISYSTSIRLGHNTITNLQGYRNSHVWILNR